ncbi:MAG: hypothetical protein HUK28_01275, partial [Methanobrevibacter sp.]|nr:hypothetical protein [Methanobrevibacter sp.]
ELKKTRWKRGIERGRKKNRKTKDEKEIFVEIDSYFKENHLLMLTAIDLSDLISEKFIFLADNRLCLQVREK